MVINTLRYDARYTQRQTIMAIPFQLLAHLLLDKTTIRNFPCRLTKQITHLAPSLLHWHNNKRWKVQLIASAHLMPANFLPSGLVLSSNVRCQTFCLPSYIKHEENTYYCLWQIQLSHTFKPAQDKISFHTSLPNKKFTEFGNAVYPRIYHALSCFYPSTLYN